ncbi:hypothetical protein [Corynebacterium sp. ED61]|uniref:hypothetical protein n=1 Tax=Corynebacterium sp. ED61 TaxID=2211360 RepID=UPI0018837D2A|nr:hypothetical protein [Corynebacterium sp. ED61]MBF0580795.1 hypothetical protein [Corynebacterium sp. ED61]
MDNEHKPKLVEMIGARPLLVGASEMSETMIPSGIRDYIWCDSEDYPSLAKGDGSCPLVVSWRSSTQLAQLISLSEYKGAWVIADSMEKVADVSALDNEIRLSAVDSLEKIPFLYLKKDSEAEEIPSRVVLDAVVATASVEKRRRLSRQGVVDEITKNIATENSSAANQRVTDSQLRRRIKSLLNGREKQLAARLPRPLFRVALKVWKAL